MSTKRFNLHLPGLLEVLAGSLYSTSKVGLRELIQNAHDSCIRRQVRGQEPNYQPRIDITMDAGNQLLSISDNGHGLSAQDIEDYLATIGRSYTKELKEDLSIMLSDEAVKLIGQFGFGFLSAFLLADEVTLITRSLELDSDALCWHSVGGEHYEITPANRTEVGTTVTLRVKPGIAFVFNHQALVESVQKYADFLSIPIYVNRSSTPVNLMRPPWQAANLEMATDTYIKRKFELRDDPLYVIHLSNEIIDLGHDTLEIPLGVSKFKPGKFPLRKYFTNHKT